MKHLFTLNLKPSKEVICHIDDDNGFLLIYDIYNNEFYFIDLISGEQIFEYYIDPYDFIMVKLGNIFYIAPYKKFCFDIQKREFVYIEGTDELLFSKFKISKKNIVEIKKKLLDSNF